MEISFLFLGSDYIYDFSVFREVSGVVGIIFRVIFKVVLVEGVVIEKVD